MNKIANAGLWIARLVVGLGASFLLFIAVAMLHSSFGFGEDEKEAPRQVLSSVAMSKPEPPKKAPPQRMRQITQTNSEGKGQQSGPAQSRFAPDLALDASGSTGDGVGLEKQELSAEVFEQGQTDESPSPEYTPPLNYPEALREQGIQGEVEVEFIITHEGKTSSIQVLRSPSPVLSAEVKKGISTWKFRPGKNKGISVNVRVRKVFVFNVK